jgi:hypothetical protein
VNQVHRAYRGLSGRFVPGSTMSIFLSLAAQQSIHLSVGKFHEGIEVLPGNRGVSILTNDLPRLRGEPYAGKYEDEHAIPIAVIGSLNLCSLPLRTAEESLNQIACAGQTTFPEVRSRRGREQILRPSGEVSGTPARCYNNPTPRVITPATCKSGVKITKSASPPIAKIPFFPASPSRRAGKIVAMRNASTKGTPTSTM